jgi:hypothetical protein
MAKAKKAAVSVSKFLKDAVNARLHDEAGMMKYPIIMECMLPVFEGSKLIRAPGKLTLQPEGAHWRVKLDCPTEVLSLTFAAQSLADCFDDLERHLASGSAIWSPGWKKNGRQLPTIDDII